MRKTPRRRTILHLSQIFLTLGRTFMAVSGSLSELLDDLGSIRIPGRKFDPDAATADQPDHDVSQARCHSGEHLTPVRKSHSEESAREHLFDRSDSRFLRSCLRLLGEPERFEHAGGDDFGLPHSVDAAQKAEPFVVR
jgi:hypothetical protein